MNDMMTSQQNNFERNSVVGYIYSIIPWESYLTNLLPKTTKEEGEISVVRGVIVVLHNTCNQSRSYKFQSNNEVCASTYKQI
jgi:predicted transcriptional regulator with HTH domain